MRRGHKVFANFEARFIRNISIISHVDHGKTTLSDHIIAEGGMLPSSMAGQLRALDFLDQEQQRGITIETSLASFQLVHNEDMYHINLIDTPGHIDFAGKVSESLRLVDNGLVIVDAVEGVKSQTRTVLRQAIDERLRLVLFINKIDRLITELHFSITEIRSRIEQIIGEIAGICRNNGMDSEEIPRFGSGTVVLGSALHGWGIDQFIAKGEGILNKIIEDYSHFREHQPDDLNIANILKRVIVTKFLDPILAQSKKFPDLLSGDLSLEVVDNLSACRPTGVLLGTGGNLFRDTESGNIGIIIRIYSGRLEEKNEVYTQQSEEPFFVQKIIYMQGKSRYTDNIVQAGNLAGVIFDRPFPIGVIFSSIKPMDINLKRIRYPQEPVVGISIEPHDLEEIDTLEQHIREITEITHGLKHHLDEHTGELLVYGIGKLQLDVLVKDLETLGLNIDTSDPTVSTFGKSTQIIQDKIVVDNHGWFEIVAGPLEINETLTNQQVHLDNNNNAISINGKWTTDFLEGFKYSFNHVMRSGKNGKNKIREFWLHIDDFLLQSDKGTYETGVICGYQVTQRSLQMSVIMVHEPYYVYEITTPTDYVGSIVTELQRIGGTVKITPSKEDNSLITGKMPVKNSFDFADTLRRLSEGNAFWSYPKIEYHC